MRSTPAGLAAVVLFAMGVRQAGAEDLAARQISIDATVTVGALRPLNGVQAEDAQGAAFYRAAHVDLVRIPDGVGAGDIDAIFPDMSADVENPKDLEGSAIDAVIPFSYLFRRVLESDEDIVSHDIRYQRNILNTSIFTIEPHSVMCGIFQDITKPIFQKEQIIGRAREVIQKNLKTVQQIAFLLGENAADSEIILNSIVRSFSPEEVDDNDAGGKQ